MCQSFSILNMAGYGAQAFVFEHAEEQHKVFLEQAMQDSNMRERLHHSERVRVHSSGQMGAASSSGQMWVSAVFGASSCSHATLIAVLLADCSLLRERMKKSSWPSMISCFESSNIWHATHKSPSCSTVLKTECQRIVIKCKNTAPNLCIDVYGYAHVFCNQYQWLV